MAQTATLAIAVSVPIVGILVIALITTLLSIAVFLLARQRKQAKPFNFVHMTHSDLEEKDLENYLATGQGSFPNIRTVSLTQEDLDGKGDIAILDLETEKLQTDV